MNSVIFEREVVSSDPQVQRLLAWHENMNEKDTEWLLTTHGANGYYLVHDGHGQVAIGYKQVHPTLILYLKRLYRRYLWANAQAVLMQKFRKHHHPSVRLAYMLHRDYQRGCCNLLVSAVQNRSTTV